MSENFGVAAWYCCLDDLERDALLFTYDASPFMLPHTLRTTWEAGMTAIGLTPGTVRYDDFVAIYLVYFFTQSFGGLDFEVVGIPDEFYFALLDYYNDNGTTCPDPCKIRHFTDI